MSGVTNFEGWPTWVIVVYYIFVVVLVSWAFHNVRVYRDGAKSLMVKVGRYACRYSWGPGRFGNGSRWSSGWHDWREQAKIDC